MSSTQCCASLLLNPSYERYSMLHFLVESKNDGNRDILFALNKIHIKVGSSGRLLYYFACFTSQK